MARPKTTEKKQLKQDKPILFETSLGKFQLNDGFSGSFFFSGAKHNSADFAKNNTKEGRELKELVSKNSTLATRIVPVADQKALAAKDAEIAQLKKQLEQNKKGGE